MNAIEIGSDIDAMIKPNLHQLNRIIMMKYLIFIQIWQSPLLPPAIRYKQNVAFLQFFYISFLFCIRFFPNHLVMKTLKLSIYSCCG